MESAAAINPQFYAVRIEDIAGSVLSPNSLSVDKPVSADFARGNPLCATAYTLSRLVGLSDSERLVNLTDFLNENSLICASNRLDGFSDDELLAFVRSFSKHCEEPERGQLA